MFYGRQQWDLLPVAAIKCSTPDSFREQIPISVFEEELEDTKGVIRIRISMKNRQNNVQKKKYKRTNNYLQNIHIKLKIE
jgi:hypothetical protein